MFGVYLQLKPLRSKEREFLEFGISKSEFENNREYILSKLNGNLSAKDSMSAPLKT